MRPGNVTALAYDAQGALVARDEYVTPGAPVVLALTVDVPSARTGTGEALLLDGQDTALLRLSVLDRQGGLVSGLHAVNVSFRVVSGLGRVVGVGNGDPSSHEHNKRSWRTTYHGLARVLVQVSADGASPDRLRRATIDVQGRGARTRTLSQAEAAAAGDIVVEASAPGFAPTTATIKVSTDSAKHGVLAVAARSQQSTIISID